MPLETWIVPRQHGCSFEEAIKPENLGDLARLLSDYFRTLARGFGDPGYEMVLHTAPNLRSRILQGDWATIRDDYHWHIEIIPEPEHANRIGGHLHQRDATRGLRRRAPSGLDRSGLGSLPQTAQSCSRTAQSKPCQE